jgi:hypothetical protein
MVIYLADDSTAAPELTQITRAAGLLKSASSDAFSLCSERDTLPTPALSSPIVAAQS